MLAFLLLAAALQAAAAPSAAATPLTATAVEEFRRSCLDTGGDVEAVSQLVSRDPRWSAPSAREELRVWTRPAPSQASLAVGPVVRNGQRRQACMLSVRPAQAPAPDVLPSAFGPNVAAADAAQGLYIQAASQADIAARRVTFILVSSTAEGTTFTAVRPER